MPGADDSKPFAVNLDDDGLFKSMVLPDAPKREQNVMKSWAAMLQVNRKKIRAGEKAFVSEEVSCPEIIYFYIQRFLSTLSHGFEDENLGSSPGWWAATVATYCPSRPGEHPKSSSSKPHDR